MTLVGQRGPALAHLSQAFESRLCNWRRPSPTGLRRQRTRLGAHGGAGPLGPEAPAAGLPQPALRPLADRVAGRGGQQGAPHTIRISKGGSRPGLMGQELAEPDAQARPDPVPCPVPRQALRSLRRYPLPLRSGKEAKILRHFGDGLCRMLDQRLQQHRSSGGERGTQGAAVPEPPTAQPCSHLASRTPTPVHVTAGRWTRGRLARNRIALSYHPSWRCPKPSHLLGFCILWGLGVTLSSAPAGDHAPDSPGAENPAPEWPPAEVPEASVPVRMGKGRGQH